MSTEKRGNLQDTLGCTGSAVGDTGRQTGGWENTGGGVGGGGGILSVSRGGEDSGEDDFLDKHYR